ncbi:MAG: DUF3078 domain-containing protein [Bacteroidia bacterium]
MKKNILTLLLISVFGLNLNAQTTATTTDTIWRTTLLAGLNLNQLSFTNWSAGGENSFSGNALLSYTAKYKKGRWGWDNVLDFAIGATKTGSDDLRKSDDKIDINSKLGYNFNKNFYLSYLLGFKSQFTEGFLYEGDNRARISNFLAPGYVLNAVGVDWKANDDVSIFISPATLKTTIVQDDELSAAGQFGVDPGEKIRNELGAYFILRYKHTVMENVDFSTKLELFSSYTNNPQNIDVNWEVLLSFKVNKYINALLQTQLIYDDDVVVPKGKENPRPGIGTQFKEVFGIGFSYKFEGAAVK